MHHLSVVTGCRKLANQLKEYDLGHASACVLQVTFAEEADEETRQLHQASCDLRTRADVLRQVQNELLRAGAGHIALEIVRARRELLGRLAQDVDALFRLVLSTRRRG